MRNAKTGRSWGWVATVGLVGVLTIGAVPGRVAAQEDEKPDKIGNITLNEETYERLAEMAKARGLNDLAEQLQGDDKDARRDAALKMITQMRQQRGRGGEGEARRPGGQRGGQPDRTGRRPGEGRDPREWMRGMAGRMGGGTVAATTTDKYLFIVRGDSVYQLDVDTLEIINQVQLPAAQGLRRPGPPDGARGKRPGKPDGATPARDKKAE